MKQAHLFVPIVLLLSGTGHAGSIQNAMVERTDINSVIVRWTDGDPVDVFLADTPNAGPAAATLVSGKDRDGSQAVAMPALTRRYLLLRDTKSGETVTVAERLLPLAQGSNFRDIGGYAAVDGQHVRWGLIYRSGATPLLSDSDRTEVRSLHLANMVDLRSSEERVLAPSRIEGVPYSAIGYSMTSMMPTDPSKMGPDTMATLYRELPAFLAPHVKLVFAKLLRNEGPIAYNCSAGQDRTGFVTAMILSALGVPRDTIIADYHLSTTYRRPEYEMPKIDLAAHPDDPVAKLFAHGNDSRAVTRPRPLKTADGTAYLASAFSAIEQKWGSVDAYLEQEAGVGPAQIAALRKAYLE